MSWQASETGAGDQLPVGLVLPVAQPPPSAFGEVAVHGWFGVCGACCSPSCLPVASSANRRGPLTTAAWAGFASGTLMTSMRQRED
jgi:hypothetical protein